MQTQALGIYIHLPFCRSKCPYCDFYSVSQSGDIMDAYKNALIDELRTLRRISEFSGEEAKSRTVGSVYFGGGTPSFFGGRRISEILAELRHSFLLNESCEITVECNPSSCSQELFKELYDCGVNRVSMGLQTAVESERKVLGRSLDASAVKNAVLSAKNAGIENISLDLMLGIPNSNMKNLKRSIDFCHELEVPHISAYMLKIEENTPFWRMSDTLDLPFEDEVCEMYLYLCETLLSSGTEQYEVSNFAVPGFESRHNLGYWDACEYLGIGAAAHSFYGGKRFFFERDIQGFINGEKAVFDCDGGSFEEYAMLRLRLNEGLLESKVRERFSHRIPGEMYEKCDKYKKNNLLIADNNGIRLTREGFLLSNIIISDLIAGE